MTYLGSPITLSRIRMVHLQFFIDCIKSGLTGWKGRLLSLGGHRVLIWSVLSAMPTFALPILIVVDRVRHHFL